MFSFRFIIKRYFHNNKINLQRIPPTLKKISPNSYRLIAFPTPPPLTQENKTWANKQFNKPAQFIKSISQLEQAPISELPEVAFVGRSNVGKSTLINQLTNNHHLVKTSSKPGHTKLLNFFDLGNKLILVDMPGYGFKSRLEWGDLIMNYLTNRKQLKRLFILIDPTAGIKETDKLLMNHLDDYAISYQIILTKKDRLSTTLFEESKSSIESYLVKHANCCYPHLLSSGVIRRSKKNHDIVTNDLAELRWSILNAVNILK